MKIEVNCERIRANAESIVAFCAAHSIEVVAVTKGVCGHPDVGRAMLARGVKCLGESRLTHVRRLREAGIDVDIMMLRLPALSEVDDVVHLTQTSLNSQVKTVRALSVAAQAQGVTHQVILMIDVGDRREGVMPEKAVRVAKQMANLPGIVFVGVGANVSCIGGVQPTHENTQLLVDVAEEIEHNLGIPLPIISGGNTSSLFLLANDEMPARVNQLRIGEGILRGADPNGRWVLPTPYQDAFSVIAEVIELEAKPSLPEGPILLDAFGRKPHWQDLGIRQRAVLDLGEQDLYVSGLTPKRPGVNIIGASSNHLVVDVTDAQPPVQLGDELQFAPNYAALATGMASHSVTHILKPIGV
ncbi:MAG: alanine/ornithine racemase family PLP-dependent enzyme [Chloroflexi bacterium]|nr:alanine/ornithine racemase family PLP-dependent enzyme [Chloroflexota bacterium]